MSRTRHRGASRERERQERAPSAPGRNGPIAATARCGQPSLGRCCVAGGSASSGSATAGHVERAASQCPRVASLDQRGLRDARLLFLSLGRSSRHQWFTAAGAASLPTASASSARATDGHGPAGAGADSHAEQQCATATIVARSLCSPYASSSVASSAHTFRRARKSRRHRQHSAIRSAGHSSAFAAAATTPTSSFPFLATKPSEHSYRPVRPIAEHVPEPAVFRRGWTFR